MKQLVLASLLVLPQLLAAQQVLYSEDFEGTSSSFALNTTDVSSVVNTDNTWLINNVYNGGNGSVFCLFADIPFTVASTAGQPAGISNANGKYLHTTSVAAVNSGINSCCFLAADGLCASAANHFVRMNSDVSTVGLGDVSFSFWWLCGGGTNNYGEVYYSTNSGSTWSLIATPIAQYKNQVSWVQQTITLPEFSGHNTLRFGFRFVNGTTSSAQDPGFGIDDVRITALSSSPPTVTTGSLPSTELCQSASINVPYVATGSFDAGNVFSAQLSNAAGSFATPLAIGTLTSTASGTIAGIIPQATVPGTGYRIRVVSSAPVVIGTPNIMDIGVFEAPFAGTDASLALCRTSAPITLLSLLGDGVSTCGVWTGPTGNTFSGTFDPATGTPGAHTYTTNCAGGCPQDNATITISVSEPPNAGTSTSITLCVTSGPISLLGVLGAATGGTWTDPNGSAFNGTLNPATAISGVYTYTVTGVAPCTSAQAVVAVVIDPCTGVEEQQSANGLVRWSGQQGDRHLFVVGEAKVIELQVIDVNGSVVQQRTGLNAAGEQWIALPNAASGIYIARMFTDKGPFAVRLYHTAE